MLHRLKALSFNARLVIVMNLSMAVIMLVAGGLFAFNILKSLENGLDHEIETEATLILKTIDKISDAQSPVAKLMADIALEGEAINSISVSKGGDTLAKAIKKKDSSKSFLSKEVKSSSGLKVKIAYTYDFLRQAKVDALLGLTAYLVFGMMFFSVALYFMSKKLIAPLVGVAGVLSEATSSAKIHADKLKEMSASVQSSGNIINSGSESTTESMRGLTGSIENSAGELSKCLSLANGVNSKADQGTGVMNRLVSSMEVIEEANKKLNELGSIFEEISSKTSVINDIVFKTQLLSFNASIEAARAGQHGRGFSVVAEEIGNLAQMSGKSATEISNLLSSSEEHVKSIISGTDEKIAEGRAVSLEALQSFDDIRRDISEITGSIGEVTTNSKGQENVIKTTLDTMVDMKETVEEQGIFTRSIGKSANAISEQADLLNKADDRVRKLIFGESESSSQGSEISKTKVVSWVNKMKKDNAA